MVRSTEWLGILRLHGFEGKFPNRDKREDNNES